MYKKERYRLKGVDRKKEKRNLFKSCRIQRSLYMPALKGTNNNFGRRAREFDYQRIQNFSESGTRSFCSDASERKTASRWLYGDHRGAD